MFYLFMPIIKEEQTRPVTYNFGGFSIETGYHGTIYEITVERDDTLASIAKSVGASPDDIRRYHTAFDPASKPLLRDPSSPLPEGKVLHYFQNRGRGLEILV